MPYHDHGGNGNTTKDKWTKPAWYHYDELEAIQKKIERDEINQSYAAALLASILGAGLAVTCLKEAAVAIGGMWAASTVGLGEITDYFKKGDDAIERFLKKGRKLDYFYVKFKLKGRNKGSNGYYWEIVDIEMGD
ncbi:hypothetical protein [Anaerophilus nitritogenes]|uniref:hypothetical protein n=1 Tax=Anaerophilus nitritogenes TaxID=2498136 RepID=UPI00101DB530|nr:hypothetical protein [Anaerophilus nitritogenes]